MPSNYFNDLEKAINKNNDNENFFAGCIAAIILTVFSLFFPPFICRYAWNFIAVRRFSLPAFTYWEWFWAVWAIRMLIPSSTSYGGKK